MGSLQVRLLFTYLVIIGVTLGLSALSLFFLLGGYREQISYGNLEDVGELINRQAVGEITAALDENAKPPEGVELLGLLSQFLNNRDSGGGVGHTSVAVVDASGRVIDYSSQYVLDEAVVDKLDLSAPAPGSSVNPRRCRVHVPESSDLLCVGVPLSANVLAAFPNTNAAAIVVAQPAVGLGEVFGDLMPRLLFSGLIGVAAALILGFVLSQSVASPLRNIARAARSVSRGNYRQRVPATGPTEVRDLAANFNRMTEEVQRSQQTLRDFLANISHELKTPLTSIRGFSEAIVDGTIDNSEGIERSARIINGESNRVLRLVEELLDLSRIESGQLPMRQESIALNELFGHVGEVFALRSEDTGIGLDVRAPKKATIRGDYDRLEQVLNNLLDNAFSHTAEGGLVRLDAREVQRGILQITVSDNGQGIPADDVPHLFERFYRSSRQEGNGTGTARKGYGLGLAITREIVRAHGGDIWVTSEEGRGTAFVFTLPVSSR